MRRVWVLLAVVVASSTTVTGQAVSEWRTARGLPVAVIEVAGGDIEHLAALVPADAAPPPALAGFSTGLKPRRSSQLWSVAVPTLAAPSVLTEFLAALSATGSAALVALGPLPTRDIQQSSGALDAIPARAPTRTRCVLAEGGLAERLGTPEAVELAFALPQPDDPRSDLTPALISLVRSRLAPRFPDVRVDDEFQDDCARLVVRVPVRDDNPRAVLQRLRQALGQLPAAPVSGEEVTRAIAGCQARAAQVTVTGATAAGELAERLALGGSASGSFSTPSIDGTSITELARQLLSGHPGFATLVEQERLPSAGSVQTLDNGVEVTIRWVPGETGVVALALGGVAPRSGREILTTAASTAAREGWIAIVGEVAGVPTLAVAAPAASITDVMEQASESVSVARPSVRDDLEAEATHALGLSDALTAETLSVALALPPEVEIGTEAAQKFFGSFASGQVRAGTASVRRGLNWTVGPGAPEVIAVVDLPQSAVGLVAWQVLHDRLGLERGVRVTALAPPGRLLAAVASEGGTDVPTLDGRLASLWKSVVRPASSAEVSAAAQWTLAALFGDTAQATARAAAAAFLPAVPGQAELLGMDVAQVNEAIAALPSWDGLTRFARGAPPATAGQTERTTGVRKSRAPQGRKR